ncbi:LOW QUALITY PROTEIN: heavy metal-associated isoprenylated plant protein 3 [Neltuma alba]|uniref:LOW QUALITY PROTEIN: heavy metal-associated isoprenylated plant protein 3 n=1 Tax=Neltuma alba TaxID=207710 RepID=UPI0010A2BB28|nr:LOW QUALITY PROTEIN: heavy metal-associated isoprenylated plant protein 3 [Prosopis alba]
MGQKKKTQNDGQTNEKNDAAKKGETTPATVVLKVDLHCDGCASKITRFLRCFQGVETVKVDGDSGKVTVTGNVDPSKLRDKLADKTKKKVDLISPQPKRDNKDPKNDKKKPDDKSEKKNPDDKKSKEPQQSTAVLKMALHCQGCIERIRKTVSKTKGVKELSIDKDKETVTVKGSMDVKALVESLKERLRGMLRWFPPRRTRTRRKRKMAWVKKKEAAKAAGRRKVVERRRLRRKLTAATAEGN